MGEGNLTTEAQRAQSGKKGSRRLEVEPGTGNRGLETAPTLGRETRNGED